MVLIRYRDYRRVVVVVLVTSVGTTRGQGIIRVVVVVLVDATFFDILIFRKIFKLKKGPQ